MSGLVDTLRLYGDERRYMNCHASFKAAITAAASRIDELEDALRDLLDDPESISRQSWAREVLAGIETGTAETVKQGSVPKG